MITADLLVDWPLSDRHSSKRASLFQLYLYYISFLAKYLPNEMHIIYWNWVPNKRKNSEVESSIDLLEDEYNNFMSTCCTRTFSYNDEKADTVTRKYIILDRYTISCAIVDVKGKQILGRCNAAQLRSDNPFRAKFLVALGESLIGSRGDVPGARCPCHSEKKRDMETLLWNTATSDRVMFP